MGDKEIAMREKLNKKFTVLLSLKVTRLILSGALLGIAVSNTFFGSDYHAGELFAGVLGAGGALIMMKLTAII